MVLLECDTLGSGDKMIDFLDEIGNLTLAVFFSGSPGWKSRVTAVMTCSHQFNHERRDEANTCVEGGEGGEIATDDAAGYFYCAVDG